LTKKTGKMKNKINTVDTNFFDKFIKTIEQRGKYD